MKNMTMVVASALVLGSLAMASPANAAGCLRGAVVGGVAGHFAGHHGLVGAGIGCAWGHHAATKRDREQMRYDRYNRY